MRFSSIIACLSFSVVSLVASAADWPQWRGPDRETRITDEGAKLSFTKAPAELWRVQIGEGYSSMAIVGNRVLAMGNAAKEDTLWCLDSLKGTVVWKYSYPCGTDRSYPGPRATPVVDGKVVYILSRSLQLAAVSLETGKPLWTKDMVREFGGQVPQWGAACSPLVEGDNLFVILGGRVGTVSLKKADGSLNWKSAPAKPAYASPVAYGPATDRKLAIFTAKGLACLDMATGKELASQDWPTAYDVNAIDPIVVGDRIFISSSYKTGSIVVDIKAGKADRVWMNKDLAAHFSTPILHKDHLFGPTGNVGEPSGSFRCIEFATGKLAWSKDRFQGSPILVNDKLVILSYTGELVVAEADPAAWKELARAKVLDGQCWTPPAMAGGLLYCRNTAGTLICLDMRQPK